MTDDEPHPNLRFTRIEADDLIFGRANELAPSERALLWTLVRHVHRTTGRCFPSVETLAALLGVSQSTVHLLRKTLVGLGVLSWETTRQGAVNGPCEYVIDLAPLRSAHPPKSVGCDPPKFGPSHPPKSGGSKGGVTLRNSDPSPSEIRSNHPPKFGPDLPERDHPERDHPEGERASAPAAVVSVKVDSSKAIDPVTQVSLSMMRGEVAERAREVFEAIHGDATLAPIVREPLRVAIDLVKLASPGVDVAREVAKAGAWLRANPTKAKKNGAAFLTSWIGRATPADAQRPIRPNDIVQRHPDAPETFRKTKVAS